MRRLTLLSCLLFAACEVNESVPGSADAPGAGPGVTAGVIGPAGEPVTAQRLVNAAAEPENWLMYSGDYTSQRYSTLDQIDRTNVADLQVEWVHQFTTLSRVETTPIVVDGLMIITESPSNIIALDAVTGRPFWRYDHPVNEDDLRLCCGLNNRGVAVLGNRIFHGTVDAHLMALDLNTGTVLWDVEVARAEAGYSITSAPLVVGDKVITGMAGGEYGVRGFLDAYDVETGELVWRYYTIPGPGEPGNETWSGDSWRTGGAPTWVTGSYDPELNLIYWGTGNPAPDWNGDMRLGDNLWSDAVVAVDADTGELVWGFQFTPHDTHDWDAIQIPVLADLEVDGVLRKLLFWANRNAFYYVLDRKTGEFLHGVEYSKQTWAEGLDENGRPIVIPGTEPTEEGNLVWPSLQGAANWFSPSYSPDTGLFYQPTRIMGAIYYKAEVEYEPGQPFLGGGEQALSGDDASGAVKALDVLTGELQWEFPLLSPPWAGVMATRGGLVFGGSNEGNIFALDAETGEALWDFQAGAGVRTAPMSFEVDGEQRVATAAGAVLWVFGLP